MTVYRRLLRLALPALCVAAFAQATRADDSLQPLPDVQRLAAAQLRSQLGAPLPGITTSVATNELDPRLRLARCPQTPVAFCRRVRRSPRRPPSAYAARRAAGRCT